MEELLTQVQSMVGSGTILTTITSVSIIVWLVSNIKNIINSRYNTSMIEDYIYLKESWTEEFSPKTIDDMVLMEETKNYFKNILNSKNVFSCCLVGSAGIGKTSLAKILVKELDASVLFIQCGVEGTVATAQGKIKTFCESLSMEGKPKVVLLDELDSSSGTQDNSMQKVLRNIISESPSTIFIATCNYPEKVIDPIKSRLGIVNLKFTKKELWSRLSYILKVKNVNYTKESLVKFVETVLKTHYPDVRRIISDLQKMCSSGTLVVPEVLSSSDTTFVSELVNKCKTEKNVLNLRQFYISNKSKIEDYTLFASALFNYVMDNGLISSGDVVLKMSNIIYQMNLVIDKEIQFFSLMCLLGKSL